MDGDAKTYGDVTRRKGRAGVILPAALLLVLGGTLIAASLLVTARSAVLLADGDRRLARSLSVRSPDGSDLGLEVSGLGGGFLLVRRSVPEVVWSVWAVLWRPDPAWIAGGLRAAAETVEGADQAGGELVGGGAAEGCPDPDPLPGHRLAVGSTPPSPSPALPDFPALGPVALEALAERGGPALPTGEPLPSGASLVVLESGARVDGGEGAGVLVGRGAVRMGGDAVFQGLVLVAGDLVLEQGAVIQGAVRVGGELRLEPGSRLVGCRATVADLLGAVAALETPFVVPGGAFLGRH